jgi:hypothetical protein
MSSSSSHTTGTQQYQALQLVVLGVTSTHVSPVQQQQCHRLQQQQLHMLQEGRQQQQQQQRVLPCIRVVLVVLQ